MQKEQTAEERELIRRLQAMMRSGNQQEQAAGAGALAGVLKWTNPEQADDFAAVQDYAASMLGMEQNHAERDRARRAAAAEEGRAEAEQKAAAERQAVAEQPAATAQDKKPAAKNAS